MGGRALPAQAAAASRQRGLVGASWCQQVPLACGCVRVRPSVAAHAPLKAIVEDAPCIVRAALGSKSSIPTAGVNRTVRLPCAQRGIASAQRRTIASAVEALETGTGIADRIG